MSKYIVSYEVEGELDVVAAKVYQSLYLGDIDASGLKIREVMDVMPGVNGGYVPGVPNQGVLRPGEQVIKVGTFDYPATQKLLKHLNENPSIVQNAQGEGDWQLSNEDKTGDD